MSDITDEPLEREFPDKKIGRLLVLPDLAEGDRPGSEATGFERRLHESARMS